jgi:hypothetical protein
MLSVEEAKRSLQHSIPPHIKPHSGGAVRCDHACTALEEGWRLLARRTDENAVHVQARWQGCIWVLTVPRKAVQHGRLSPCPGTAQLTVEPATVVCSLQQQTYTAIVFDFTQLMTSQLLTQLACKNAFTSHVLWCLQFKTEPKSGEVVGLFGVFDGE